MKPKPRKKIHPATVKRIIREHEERERFKIMVEDKCILDVSLAQFRDLRQHFNGENQLMLDFSLGRGVAIGASPFNDWTRIKFYPIPRTTPISSGAPPCAAACGAKPVSRWQKIKQTVKAFLAGIVTGMVVEP